MTSITRGQFLFLCRSFLPIKNSLIAEIEHAACHFSPSSSPKRTFSQKKFPKLLVISQILRTFAPANHGNTRLKHALLAQLVEQLTLNQWVQGSNP